MIPFIAYLLCGYPYIHCTKPFVLCPQCRYTYLGADATRTNRRWSRRSFFRRLLAQAGRPQRTTHKERWSAPLCVLIYTCMRLERKMSRNRRRFLQALALGSGAYTTPGLFAEVLKETVKLGDGPFYPDKMPLDT